MREKVTIYDISIFQLLKFNLIQSKFLSSFHISNTMNLTEGVEVLK